MIVQKYINKFDFNQSIINLQVCRRLFETIHLYLVIYVNFYRIRIICFRVNCQNMDEISDKIQFMLGYLFYNQ